MRKMTEHLEAALRGPIESGERSALEHVLQARAGQRALLRDPQVRQLGVVVTGAGSQVPVEGHGGLAAEGAGALAAALAGGDRHVQVEVDVVVPASAHRAAGSVFPFGLDSGILSFPGQPSRSSTEL